MPALFLSDSGVLHFTSSELGPMCILTSFCLLGPLQIKRDKCTCPWPEHCDTQASTNPPTRLAMLLGLAGTTPGTDPSPPGRRSPDAAPTPSAAAVAAAAAYAAAAGLTLPSRLLHTGPPSSVPHDHCSGHKSDTPHKHSASGSNMGQGTSAASQCEGSGGAVGLNTAKGGFVSRDGPGCCGSEPQPQSEIPADCSSSSSGMQGSSGPCIPGSNPIADGA
eukprot:scaffold178777_cov18-Tisochrysis_lutea.AAC.1